ncbi:MAG: hypothetical protein QF444_01280 [Phycisphaerales bacterium]|nr:hypothetical protein [Phycisphaerales bacterium]
MNLKIASLYLVLVGCSGQTMKNPSATLRETGRPPSAHLQAMEMLDSQLGLDNPKYMETLHRMLWVPGYTNDAREGALSRLWRADRQGVIKTVRQRLPRMNNWPWIETLCEWITENVVVELDLALISSWSQPTNRYANEQDRPERKALVALYTEEALPDLVFNSLLATSKSWQQGYRTRCWELLLRIGSRDRLVSLLTGTEIPNEDFFLLDLQRASLELGILPANREEILWIREICKPEYADFWNEAVETLANLDPERRDSLEMRDIPIAVAVSRHWPALASEPTSSLVRSLEKSLEDRKHYFEYEGGGNSSTLNELIRSHRNQLTWGDAIAIRIALAAIQVPEVKSHFFDYANRDLLDKTTEYGGVLELDNKGRFIIKEFEPKIRSHDRRFNATQEMFDSAYTSLFHFHFHAQKHRNGDHAGPGMGDKNYADNTRANCLVLTFVNSNTMNVDYYRHGHVVVDLGTMSIN